MQISSISALLGGSLFVFLMFWVFYFYLFHIQKNLCLIQIKSLIFSGILVFFRFFMPLEFSASKNILSRNILPTVHQILELQIGKLSFPHLLIGISLGGSIILFLQYIVNLLKWRKLCKYAKPLSTENVINTVREIEQKKKKQIHIRVLESKLVTEPILTGIFHPKVILPYNFIESDLRYILSHEIEHYLKRDLLLKFFIEIGRILFWWNPFFYFLKNKIIQSLEFQADLETVKTFTEEEKLLYLECLLSSARKKQRKVTWGLAFREGNASIIKKRVFLILEEKYIKRRSNICYFLLPLIVFSLSFCFVVEPYYITEEQEQESFSLDDNINIKKYNDYYEIIIDGESIGKVENIPNEFSDIPVVE